MIEGKKILLTGFTGRLAGSLSGAILGRNEVWGAALRAKPEEEEFWKRQGMKIWVGDLGDSRYDGLPMDFEYVIHTAAYIYGTDYEAAMRTNAEAPALLMHHCRSAKAFLHMSTGGVYQLRSDPWYLYRETDPIGGAAFMGHYSGTKVAGEGAVRGMARLLNLPTIICRMDVQYGTFVDGGMPVNHLRSLIRREPIALPESVPFVKAPIHERDLMDLVEPSFAAASVPATTVNWCGDEAFDWREAIDYMAGLIGEQPIYDLSDERGLIPGAGDATKRKRIAGPCKVNWRDGLREIVQFWEDRIRRGVPSWER